MNDTRNPRTGLLDYAMPVAGEAEVADAAQALRERQPAWAALPAAERAQALRAWRERLLAAQGPLSEALLADTGRWHEGVLEVQAVAASLSRWADQGPGLLASSSARASLPFLRLEQQAQPYPLVGVISPWNFPLLLSLIDAIPALMAGCAVLVKPSEVTPRFVEPLHATLGGLPLAFVTGAGPTGQALIEQVDTIAFTGSVATGRKVAEQAARRFIPAQLELGGKDAALVFSDADLPRAARSLAWGSMVNAGQSCMSLERSYVERAAFDAFAALLAERVGALRLNTADPREGQIGPLIAAAQARLIQAQLDDAYALGARALCGGQLVEHQGGIWCQPTVLVDVHHGMRIMREETFGPLLPLMPFDSEGEAVRLANDSVYGLSGAVFSADLARARRVAAQLQAGAVSINDCSLTALVHEGAKQSFGLSGLGGSRMGPQSIQRFVRQQLCIVSDGTPSPWWF